MDHPLAQVSTVAQYCRVGMPFATTLCLLQVCVFTAPLFSAFCALATFAFVKVGF